MKRARQWSRNREVIAFIVVKATCDVQVIAQLETNNFDYRPALGSSENYQLICRSLRKASGESSLQRPA
jgi:hypothetical protein